MTDKWYPNNNSRASTRPDLPRRAESGHRRARGIEVDIGRVGTLEQVMRGFLLERDRILAALTRCNWNRVRAAQLVGLPRRTFYRRLKEYGIQ